MSSQAQIDANRRNAQHSTGPTSEEGKARVGRNALKHGLLSEETVLVWEEGDEYYGLRAALFADLRPRGAAEDLLADRVVAQAWRLRRLLRTERYLYERDMGRAGDLEDRRGMRRRRPFPDCLHPEAVGEALHESMGCKHSAYETLRRYERTITSTMDTALRELRLSQAARAERGDEASPAADGTDVVAASDTAATAPAPAAHEAPAFPPAPRRIAAPGHPTTGDGCFGTRHRRPTDAWECLNAAVEEADPPAEPAPAEETLALHATDGTNGANGTDGTDGANDADGTDGADGVDGTHGTNGADGTHCAGAARGANAANAAKEANAAYRADAASAANPAEEANPADAANAPGEAGRIGLEANVPGEAGRIGLEANAPGEAGRIGFVSQERPFGTPKGQSVRAQVENPLRGPGKRGQSPAPDFAEASSGRNSAGYSPLLRAAEPAPVRRDITGRRIPSA